MWEEGRRRSGKRVRVPEGSWGGESYAFIIKSLARKLLAILSASFLSISSYSIFYFNSISYSNYYCYYKAIYSLVNYGY